MPAGAGLGGAVIRQRRCSLKTRWSDKRPDEDAEDDGKWELLSILSLGNCPLGAQ